MKFIIHNTGGTNGVKTAVAVEKIGNIILRNFANTSDREVVACFPNGGEVFVFKRVTSKQAAQAEALYNELVLFCAAPAAADAESNIFII